VSADRGISEITSQVTSGDFGSHCMRRPGRHSGASAPSCFTVSGYACSAAVRKPAGTYARRWNYFTSSGHCRGNARRRGAARNPGRPPAYAALRPLDQLTPQEQHIAGLVTNADIAARLFLSPQTIDHHLHEVFTKLGIASRIELARRVLPSARRTEQQDR
jgi:DNA-binding CsgD family transcriptional regulator